MDVIKHNWKVHIDGHNMFKVVSKLKRMKKPLLKLLHDHGNLHDRVNKLSIELDQVQTALDLNPADANLRDEESIYLQAFNEAKLDEESRIEVILNAANTEVSGSQVPEVFVAHYEQFLGTSTACNALDMEDLFFNKVSELTASNMVRNITNEEVKSAMFDIGDDKAPGPDGFTSTLFKKGWEVVGNDVCNAVRDFFSNGCILKEINHTFLTLIPKVTTPLKVNDYHPISCCNVIYKCISKILTNRIIEGIKEVEPWSSEMCIQDIQKAYDTVDWAFLENILGCFGFPNTMIKWIMSCVSSTSFSLCINGNIHGYFKCKRGLRQVDPLSPYLFTMVMEVLTLILKRRVHLSDSFRYHKQCEDLAIINVCFADDLFIFARGDVESARVILDSLEEFKLTSGLVSSIPKSTTYFCNVPHHVKQAILNIMPFSKGDLPVKYLGVPLILSWLLNKDCKVLVEKSKNRISDWKNKSLSFAGRLQLCKSGRLQLLKNPRTELVIGRTELRGKAKVAWEDICLPKWEGGLGLRNLDVFNIALLTTHIWNIVSNKESLWVWWIHTYKLKGRSIWDIPLQSNMSWGWLKLLQIWDLCLLSPLSRSLTPRDITREGFHIRNKVADLVSNGAWNWPHFWLQKALELNPIATSNIEVSRADIWQWRDSNGMLSAFSVTKLWEAIRPRGLQLAGNPMRNKRTARIIIGKLILAIASYFIWLERYNRLFKKVKKTPEDIRDTVMVSIRHVSFDVVVVQALA
ncbi:hypothetical protein Tco_0369588 [Tanacetum coccineum]